MPTENRSSNAEHALKIHEDPFAELLAGAKTCEVRKDDRSFTVGDTVQLHECGDADYTGRTLRRTITHIQRGYGLTEGLCVLSYALPAALHQGEPVAWVHMRDGEPDYDHETVISNVPGDAIGNGDSWEPVYLHPPTSEGFSAEQMTVQGADGYRNGIKAAAELAADYPELAQAIRDLPLPR